MSDSCRPWFPWFPKDFANDLKVKNLSYTAELIYRRILDAIWQTEKCKVKNDPKYIYNISCKDIPFNIFETAWKEIQAPKEELLIQDQNGMLFSKRLIRHYNECLEKSEKARKSASYRWAKKQK